MTWLSPPKPLQAHRFLLGWILEQDGLPKHSEGVVLRHERLGGILSHYYRDAA